jgi:hypothetical protein
MSLTKEKVLEKTRNGYDVFCHYLGSSLTAPNKAFKNPFYSDTKASCYVYADKHTKIFKIKDFGDPEFSGDCFFLVGKIKKLSCDDKHDFIAILKLINTDLRLDLDDSYEKTLSRRPKAVYQYRHVIFHPRNSPSGLSTVSAGRCCPGTTSLPFSDTRASAKPVRDMS